MTKKEIISLYRIRQNRGVAIPIVLSVLLILSMVAIFAIDYGRNQDAKTFHIVNVEKAKMVSEAAIEAVTHKVRKEINNLGNMNPVSLVKDVINMVKDPGASWYIKSRIPGIVVSGGVGSSTGVSGVDVELSLSPDSLGIPSTWNEQKLTDGEIANIKNFISEIGGNASKSKVECKVSMKDMKPVVSDDGYVLWPGAATDDNFVKDWIKKLGNKLFDFIGLNDIKFSIDLGKFIEGLKITIYGIPIPIGAVIKECFGSLLKIEINVGEMLSKALEKIVDQIKIGDIMPIKASIVIEKLATLVYKCRVEFVPDGTNTPIVTEVEATRDIKVVDIASPNPLYSFYWLNQDNTSYGEDTWGNLGGGAFTLMNLNITKGYNGKDQGFDDVLSFFKGLFSFEIVRFPGLCFMGGTGKQSVPTGWNDALLIYPEHSPAITMVGNIGKDKCFLPSQFLAGAPGADAIPWFPWVSVPPIGVIGIVKVVMNIAQKKGANTRLFGDLCLSPPLNMKISGNVVKTFKRVDGVGITFPVPFPPCMLGLGCYLYRSQEKGYSYSFFEKEAQIPKADEGLIENIYKPDQYKKKASLVYANGNDFLNDASNKDSSGITRIDGVIYIEGPATISGPFYGSGQIVVNGDLTINGHLTHIPKDGDRIIPFGIICFGKVNFAGGNVIAPVYAQEGISVTGDTDLYGNLVCKKFNPGSISRKFRIWYTPEVTTSSFMGLLPYVGRYMPDRYRVILSNQLSTFKILKVSN